MSEKEENVQKALRQKIYHACKDPKKMNDLKKVAKEFGHNVDVLKKNLQMMVRQKFLLMLKDANDGEMIFQAVPYEKISALKDVSDFDLTVYQFINNAGDMGITKRDLGRKVKKHSKIIDQSLKNLVTKNLIKAVQSIKSKQKVFMLYDVEPNREITGGIWYTENMTFNTKLITELQKATVKYLVDHGHGTTNDMLRDVKARGLSASVELQENDMKQIINTLLYDGLIEEAPDSRESEPTYRLMRGVEMTNPFSQIPCSNCPVFSDCVPGSDVNPADCEYLSKWADKLRLTDW